MMCFMMVIVAILGRFCFRLGPGGFDVVWVEREGGFELG